MKAIGKGWNRSLKTWLALSASPEERAVWREGLRMKTVEDRPTHEDLAPLAKGADAKGKWWGSKRGER